MSTLAITKSYADSTVLTEAQLDDLRTSIEDFVNVTKLGQDNLQDDAVGTDQLAPGAVTSPKLTAACVTTVALAAGAVTTVKISDAAVTTAKISDAAVTASKLSAANYQLSGSSGSYSTSSGTYVQPTNLSVSLTTLGRPVMLMLVSDGSPARTHTTSAATVTCAWHRDGGEIFAFEKIYSASIGGGNTGPYLAVDPVAAGTYTYDFRIKTSGASVDVTNFKMLAIEL